MSVARVFIKAVEIGVVCLAGYFVGSVVVDCVENGKKAVKDAEQRKQNGDGKLYEFEFYIDSGMCAEGEDEIWKDTAASYEEAEAHIRSDSKDFGFKIKSIGRVVEPKSSACGTPEEFYHWQATKDEPIPFKEKAKIFSKAMVDELLTKMSGD